MITTVQCSICSQLNTKPRVVVTYFRLHHTCSIIIIMASRLTGLSIEPSTSQGESSSRCGDSRGDENILKTHIEFEGSRIMLQ